MGNVQFTIADNGTIKRPSNINATLLRVVHVSANKISPLAAYKARKKCYKICKDNNINDYQNYVDELILNHFPKEFKKAELGSNLIVYRWICSIIYVITAYMSAGSIAAWTEGNDFEVCILVTCISVCLILISIVFTRKMLSLQNDIKMVDKNNIASYGIR